MVCYLYIIIPAVLFLSTFNNTKQYVYYMLYQTNTNSFINYHQGLFHSCHLYRYGILMLHLLITTMCHAATPFHYVLKAAHIVPYLT